MKYRKRKVEATSHHRNGVSGDPFQVSIIHDPDGGRMVMIDFGPGATGFEDENYGTVAVLNIEELAAGNIAFAQGNSWRGDVYADMFRPLVKAALT